jgi:hypothetical protein
MPRIAYSQPGDSDTPEQLVVVSSATHDALRGLLGADVGLLTAPHLTLMLKLARDELPGQGLVEVLKVLNGFDAVRVRLL